MTEPITIAESKLLISLERDIDGAKDTFATVAKALATIRDRKLYRNEHATFSEYCAKRHGWAKSYGYNMAKCGEVLKGLPDSAIAENAGQVRQLAKVPEAKRAEVIDIASSKAQSEDRPMTAKDIKEAATQAEPEALPDPPAPRTQDDAWKKAIGCTDARNFFAGQLEDIGTSCIESGSVDQIKAFKLQCEVWAKKAASSITKKLQSAK